LSLRRTIRRPGPYRILMRLLKAKDENETVYLPGERFLDVG